MKSLSSLSILFLVLITGCGTTNNDDDSTPPIGTFEATVKGELRKGDGIAASNTRINVFTHETDCDGEKVSQGVITTNSGGRFNKQIIDVIQGKIGCITLEISANKELGLPDTTVSLNTDLELKPNAPFDEEEIFFIY